MIDGEYAQYARDCYPIFLSLGTYLVVTTYSPLKAKMKEFSILCWRYKYNYPNCETNNNVYSAIDALRNDKRRFKIDALALDEWILGSFDWNTASSSHQNASYEPAADTKPTHSMALRYRLLLEISNSTDRSS